MELNLRLSDGGDGTIEKRKRQIETARFTLDVLLEKLERENGCEYCTGKRKWFGNTGIESTMRIGQDFHGAWRLFVLQDSVPIANCPKCGRRLEGEQDG